MCEELWSRCLGVNMGDLQGSLQSSLLLFSFLLFINDLTEHTDPSIWTLFGYDASLGMQY